MQILALYVRESTSEEGALRPHQRERSPPPLFDECKEIFFFFLLLLFREPDPTGSGNLHLWVPPVLSPTHRAPVPAGIF